MIEPDPAVDELETLRRECRTLRAALKACRDDRARLEDHHEQAARVHGEVVREEAERRLRESERLAGEAKSVFLATMSHELRTPLAAVIGYTDLVAEQLRAEGVTCVDDDVAHILGAAHHLLELIDGVMELSRIEAGQGQVDLQPSEVAALVAQVDATARTLVERGGNRFLVHVDPATGWLRTDALKVRQILLHLLSNAAKFTAGGEVRLEAWRTPDGVAFEVSDTGIGMSPPEQRRIFEPFHQVDRSTTRRFAGTGLGLTLCERFTELLGGTIGGWSAPGAGARFTVTFPDHPDPT